LRENAKLAGFDLRGITFLDLSPSEDHFFEEAESYDIFSTAEVERQPVIEKIVAALESQQPERLLIDSMTQFRYLSANAYQFRRQTLSFLRFLVNRGTTVLMTSDTSPEAPDDDLRFMADGSMLLALRPTGRTLSVSKFRGSGFRTGEHSMRLTSQGIVVFPKLIPERLRHDFVSEPLSSGVPELDELLHGGLERGTVTMITGPSGTGKTTLGLQFIKEAAGRGEASVVYTFEEGQQTLLNRCENINMPVRSMLEGRSLAVYQIEPLRYTPDEFARNVRREVEDNQRKLVMIDSLTGYGLSMQGRDLATHLHALSMYLKSVGVSVLLVNELEHITGAFRATDNDLAYLADNLIFLRYVEIAGAMHKAIGVLKKRAGDFEKTLRELKITRDGLKIGEPLHNLRGILSGMPEWIQTERNVP
jgi:circadian clock protein KaiC